MSKQYPAQYGRSPLYRNPDGTLPMPAGAEIPITQWYSTNQPVQWGAATNLDGGDNDGLPTGFQYTATWASPDFDLRPDLRSAQAGPKAGVPIWSPSARLFVTLRAPSSNPGQASLVVPNLTVLATEFTSDAFNFTTNVATFGAAQGLPGLPSSSVRDVSSQFNPSATVASVLAGFSPPGTGLGGGEGYPVRYWRISLAFTIIVEAELPLPNPALAAPRLSIDAAMY